MKPALVHVANVEISAETGMGRVAGHWRQACENAGWEFIHLGPADVGPVGHAALFPRAAFRAWRAQNREANLFLVHEPAAAPFLGRGVRTVVFSHGLERRSWDLSREGKMDLEEPLRWRTRMCFPLWRLRSCDIGLRRAEAVFLINEDDARYAAQRYALGPERRWIFHNGVAAMASDQTPSPNGRIRILFIGNWLARKGARTLSEAAAIVQRAGIEVEWTLAGVGRPAECVLAEWPASLVGRTKVIPHFPAAAEAALLRDCDIYVLPSFFEGQPLALLQAMAAGRCCVTTNCCGQRDFITHRKNGLLHEPGDANTLSELIIECAQNAVLRHELGEAAKLSVAQRTWAVVSAQVARQLDSVARNGKIDPAIPPE